MNGSVLLGGWDNKDRLLRECFCRIRFIAIYEVRMFCTAIYYVLLEQTLIKTHSLYVLLAMALLPSII